MATQLLSKIEPLKPDAAALNEAMMLALVRQHELTERAEQLNARLQAESAARKKAEEALISTEKLASVGRMAAVLAHEINNPLEAVTNVLYLAQTSEGVPEGVRHYLQMADAELKRIAHITRQTLGFYRESSAATTFKLATVLESVVDLLQAKQRSTRAAIEVRCERHLEMTAFHGEMRQVLANLLMNSLDAIGEGGRVVLRAAHAQGVDGRRSCIRITVADDGQGIWESSLGKVFEPFFTTKGAMGNGLGLWVSKQIVEKHGGAIQVRSRTSGPWRGTTVSVVLPDGGA